MKTQIEGSYPIDTNYDREQERFIVELWIYNGSVFKTKEQAESHAQIFMNKKEYKDIVIKKVK